jgi:hypothetical protein
MADQTLSYSASDVHDDVMTPERTLLQLLSGWAHKVTAKALLSVTIVTISAGLLR